MQMLKNLSPDLGELKNLLSRSQLADEGVRRAVVDILADVRARGDAAVLDYTARFDHVVLTAQQQVVSEQEIAEAYAQVDGETLRRVRQAAENIRSYHQLQKRTTFMDFSPECTLGQIIRPLKRVGVYVPGGTAAYPSSVLMNIVPAKVAGVPEIYMTTPPMPDGKVYPLTAVCAVEAGATRIFKMGGAQAVAALAYGTATVPRVDKITGPGNIFVANAKREVYGHVGIDMIAGPSEVLVIADRTANPEYVAADLLSQAEHDPLAAVVLVTDSGLLADNVAYELTRQIAKLERRDIAQASLDAYGAIVLVENLDQAVRVANEIAPEHLELAVADPYALLPRIENAGAVFLGHYTPEPVGDYWAGPNHTLPTSGTARFSSPLGVDDFIKRMSVIQYSKKTLLEQGEDIAAFADTEGLTAHANAVRVRLKREGETHA